MTECGICGRAIRRRFLFWRGWVHMTPSDFHMNPSDHEAFPELEIR